MKQCLQECYVAVIAGGGVGVGQSQRATVEEIPNQDLDHLDRLVESGSDLSDGEGHTAAVQQQSLALGTQLDCLVGS
ncbi:hypothetical protein WKI67_42115 [Streptomyces sp. MS2.AVA.5]|uniref:Uncharacterized protein n=1 Tax=Streptomyces achmelvichensis TaxID=3134111 RepID=A0ACC6Q9W6_9ACTN